MKRILRSGRLLPRLAHHRRAVHAGHDHVADQQLDLLAAAEHFERVLAIVGGDHRIAVTGQGALGDAADHRLVLDQQHRAAAPQLVLLGLAGLARSAARRPPRGARADR